ncbi:hypothetical protein D3C87_1522240 [compost metagenome]
MLACEQTSGMNMMQHGASVYETFLDLKEHVTKGTLLKFQWKLPEWASNPKLWENLLDERAIEEYQLFHDCGKPFCRTVDDEGKQHFPDHAATSEKIWREIGGDEQVAKLIGMDMDIHLLKDEGIADFAKRPEAASLLLTGLAEIHSNAKMFGGIDSTSFKIKWKHIDKRGKKIVALLA